MLHTAYQTCCHFLFSCFLSLHSCEVLCVKAAWSRRVAACHLRRHRDENKGFQIQSTKTLMDEAQYMTFHYVSVHLKWHIIHPAMMVRQQSVHLFCWTIVVINLCLYCRWVCIMYFIKQTVAGRWIQTSCTAICFFCQLCNENLYRRLKCEKLYCRTHFFFTGAFSASGVGYSLKTELKQQLPVCGTSSKCECRW